MPSPRTIAQVLPAEQLKGDELVPLARPRGGNGYDDRNLPLARILELPAYGRSLGSRIADNDPRVSVLGDSLDEGATQGGWYARFIHRHGDEYVDCGNHAHGGENTTQMLGHLNEVVASGARRVFVGGGTNDIPQGIPDATTKANLESIWAYLLNRGIAVVDLSLYPVNDDASPAGRRDRHLSLSLWRLMRCRQLGIPHVNRYTPLANGTNGAFASGMDADGLHASWLGNQRIADAVRAKLVSRSFVDPLLARRDEFGHPSRPVQNGWSLAQAGTPGVPAGFYTLNPTGATFSLIAATGIEGGWARMTLNGATDTSLCVTDKNFVDLGWNVGDTIFLGANVRWNGALSNVSVVYSSMVPTSQPMWQQGSGPAGETCCIQHQTQIVSGSAVSVRFRASGTGYLEINRPILINLTQMGLA